jgi:hypothetical protein
VQRESARRLARLGGTEPQLQPIPRRREPEAGCWWTHPCGLTICASAKLS